MKEEKKIIKSTIIASILMFLLGMMMGCLIMTLDYSDELKHYNQCQESQLLKTISELRDEKSWYIKEDKNGKIKVVQYSVDELDSLSK